MNTQIAHSLRSFGSVTEFLNNFRQTDNLTVIKKLHGYLLRSNLVFVSPNLYTELVVSYIACKANTKSTLTNCLKFLGKQNPLPFNVLVSSFSQSGFAILALKTMSFMHVNSVFIDTYAICSSLTASSLAQDVNFGKQIHAHVEKSGWLASVFVGSALIDFYAKSKLVDDAAMLFDEMSARNSVCANALLSGFGEVKMWVQGIELIRKMHLLDLEYDHFTFSAMLRACAGLSNIELGRQVHGHITRKGFDIGYDVFLRSSLIEMYGKCGFILKALQVFNLAGFRVGEGRKSDIVLWTSMLGVFSRNGYFDDVIELFEEMLKEGISPDGVAFVTLISACGRTGQVELGVEYFESMEREFELKPGPEHYSCVIDMFCRAGELDRAWKFVNEMHGQWNANANVSMWGALLSACEEHGNLEIGKLAAQEALKLEPQNAGIYMMLSNLYTRFSMWDEVDQLRVSMKERGIKKDVGRSWIQATA